MKGCSTQIDNLERQVQEAERRVLEKQQSLDHLLEGSNAEIQRNLNDFDGLMRQRQQELQTLQRSVSKLNAEIAQVRESTTDLVARRGQGEMLQAESAKLKQRQAESGALLQRKYNLPALPPVVAGAGWAPTVVRSFLQSLNNEVRSSPIRHAPSLFTYCFFVLVAQDPDRVRSERDHRSQGSRGRGSCLPRRVLDHPQARRGAAPEE